MYKLSSDFRVAGLRFSGVSEATVTSSWDNLTDTATVTVPRFAWFEGKNVFAGEDARIRRGSPVSLGLGYDGRNHTRLEGYVRSVSADVPVRIECEDAMWQLKTTQVNKSWRTVTLRELLREVLPASVPFEAVNMGLGPFRITRASVAEVLQELRDTYTLRSFLRDGKLYVGLAYWPQLQRRHKIRWDVHVPAGGGSDLEWREADDVRVKLRVIVVKPDNSREEYDFGDADGELRTVHFYDVPAADVKARAEHELERLRYTGYRGVLEIFGEPFVQHGDIVELFDPRFTERGGAYLVKEVEARFGDGGYRQFLDLETRVS